MANQKTLPTTDSVAAFIETVEQAQKRKDSYRLIAIMQEICGDEPVMWGPSIIGFGSYHYKYASGHEGDAPLVGFSPRKAAISLYAFTGLEKHRHLLDDLGKFTMGKACIYVKRLSDLNEDKLKTLIQTTVEYMQKKEW